MNKKKMYVQIFKLIYFANINRLIDETKYVSVLQKLNSVGFKTYHVSEFDTLMINMKKVGLNDSFNMSMLLYFRDVNYKRIMEIVREFSNFTEIFSGGLLVVEKIKIMKENLIRVLKIMKSFKKIDRKSPDCGTVKITQKNIIWEENTKNELMERLHLIVRNYFTLGQLKYMNVELKYASEIMTMNYETLETYYMGVISKIEESIKEWITLCRIYIDVEVNYIECCNNMINGNITMLKLKNFNIEIKE